MISVSEYVVKMKLWKSLKISIGKNDPKNYPQGLPHWGQGYELDGKCFLYIYIYYFVLYFCPLKTNCGAGALSITVKAIALWVRFSLEKIKYWCRGKTWR